MDNKSAITAEAAPVVIEATRRLEEVNREPKDDVEKDTNYEKISEVMEILQGLANRLQKIKEKMDCRFQKIEEKMDLLISSISLNNKVAAAVKTSSAKAQAENMYMDESSSDEEPFSKKARANTKIPKEESSGDHIAEISDEKYSDHSFGLFGGRGQESDDRFDIFGGPVQASDGRFSRFSGRGRGQERDERFDLFSFGRGRARFFYDGQENYDHFGRFPGDYGQDSYGRFFGGPGGGRSRGRGRGLFVGGPFAGGRCGGQGHCGIC
ncbi:unnamed protein product [Eruca vesicaria subsp. sativa]|uniref:Glycine-rich protein n=1 Tax=Eruca vesicaria subsp. sativa TaxID=29727 RepID=A0ABC8LY39_ERUVS|nr:unnamed protein product [Eruca vesicaria subsp. sativa]